jgi:hypothetical protein
VTTSHREHSVRVGRHLDVCLYGSPVIASAAYLPGEVAVLHYRPLLALHLRQVDPMSS